MVPVKSASYKIGMLTPYAWTVPGGVNQHIAALAERFTAMGHRVTIIAPSDDKAQVREGRRRVRAVLLGKREAVFDADEPYPRYFLAGGTYPVRYNRSTSVIAAPVDLISNIDVFLESEDLDILHLHEPFVPSLGWTALRHATCPMVATFHANAEGFFSYWITKPIFQRFFEAFDGVIAVSAAARDTAARYFEGDYRIIPNGIDLGWFHPAPRRKPGPLRILFVGTESQRKGLKVLLRALRYLGTDVPPFELDVCGSDLQEQRYGRLVPEAVGGAVRFRGRIAHERLPELYQQADIFCAPSLGNESFGIVLLEAMATRTAIVASDIDGYRDVVTDGEEGTLVPPRDARRLAAALRRLMLDAELRERYALRGLQTAQRYSWDIVAGQVMDLYGDVVCRLKGPARSRRHVKAELYADFHLHTNHSADCVTTVDELLVRAREVGLDVVAVTDHNTVAGGLEAASVSDRYGVRVIVGEEIKTRDGEVIGLFLRETIPAGLSFDETIACIRQQGGIVYVPHPFDRLHNVPTYDLLRAHVHDLDVMEVFNSRVAFPGFNERAERFARRYRIPAAAGSDAHVLPGLGTALTGIGEFTGAGDFVEALTESHIVRRPKSLIYLQSLKFLQTSFEGGQRP